MFLALTIVAAILPPAELPSGGIVATVSGGERPWVLAIPLDSQLAVRTYDAREPVTIAGVGKSALVCAGADDRATRCERIAAGADPQRRYALDEGRQVTGRWFIGRRPVGGAAVRVRLARVEARRPLMIPLARGAKDWVTAVSTDETGRYAIDHLAPAEYIFELTTRSGRIEESVAVEIPPLKPAVPDQPPPSRAYSVPDVRLEEGLNLVVDVRSTDGMAIPGASVGLSQPPMAVPPRRSFETKADDEGIATLDGLEPGVATRVSCAATGYSRFSETFEVLPPLVTCVLGKLSKIAGTVVDAEGSPVPHAALQLLGAHLSATAEATGAFAIDAVSPGTHTLRASSPASGTVEREVVIGAGETLDIGQLVLGETRDLRGRVVSAATGEAVPGASVTATDPPGPSAVTDPDGFFVLRSDAKMQTRVRVAADGFAPVHSALEPAATIRLPRPGSLALSVWDDETGEPCVACTMVAGNPDGFISGITDGEGHVELTALAPGDYQVSRERTIATSRGVSVSGGSDTQVVSVRANETTHLQFGSQRKLVRIAIDPAPPADLALWAHGPQRVVTAALSRPGMFSFRARPNEAYELRLGTPEYGVVVGQVPADSTTQLLSFTLGNGEVQLRITKNETPATGLRVRLVSAAGLLAGWAVTDANGLATIPYLRPDSYTAVAEGRSLGTVSVPAGRAVLLAGTIE
jgi:hypothetical protein